MQDWLHEPSDIIVLHLNSDKSGFKELLSDTNMKDEKMHVLIEVLAKASSSCSSAQGLLNVYSKVFTREFVNRLICFQMKISMQTGDNKQIAKYFDNQLRFITAFSRAMPIQAADLMPELVRSVTLVLPQLVARNVQDMTEIVDGYNSLMNQFDDYIRKKEEKRVKSEKMSWKDKLALLDMQEPNEDFRNLSVVPTADDLLLEGRPQIRRNLTDKNFKDVDTYLDVHFRLLREDFIRPLREGIQSHINSEKGFSKDVRIYRNVTFVNSDIARGKLVNFIKLSLPKKFKLESSKRLLYGNVLIISNNNFKSFLLASVAHRDEAKMKNGIVGISFYESAPKNIATSFTVVESRTFFTAYKHVLAALQTMHDNNFPLAEHIVFVQKHVDRPQYLFDGENHRYDLRVIKDFSLMKKQTSNFLFFDAQSRNPSANESPHLSQLNLMHGVEFWPPHGDFGLDSSQLQALHAALTRRLVIIQGPPGTGKTFLGLKITQVLLHNSQAWSTVEHTDLGNEVTQPPILVVCYTNHALDQFLEGMQQFTRRIVRIGGRSKSEDIQKYQIGEHLAYLKREKKLPREIHFANIDLNENMTRVEHQFR